MRSPATLAVLTQLCALASAQDAAPVFASASGSVEIHEGWPANVPLPFAQPLAVHVSSKMKSSSVQLFVMSRSAKVAGAFLASPSVLKAPLQGADSPLPFSLVLTDPAILDLEAEDSPGGELSLEVEALETDSGLSTRLPLKVIIRDSNDFAPAFSQPSYAFNVSGTAREGAEVGVVRVADRDAGAFGLSSVVYSLSGAEAAELRMAAGAEPGVLRIVAAPCGPARPSNCTLAERVPASFPVVVRAVDAGGEGKASAVVATLTLRTSDQRSPVFIQPLYERSIVEKASEFLPLLQVKAEDPDGSKIAYSLEDPSGLFKVHPSTGIVYPEYPKFLIVENVGRELNLTAVASDGRNLPARATIRISLAEAEEKRNRAPVFDRSSYAFRVAPGEKFVGAVSATDPEGNVSYAVSQGGAGLILVDAKTGALSFNGDTPLRSVNYTLRVIAVDESKEGRIGRATVEVMVEGLGSQPPSFIPGPTASVGIRENALPGSLLHTFRAQDPDPDAYLVFKVLKVAAFDRFGRPIAANTSLSGIAGAGPLESMVVFGGRGFTNGSLYLAKAVPSEMSILSLVVTVSVVDAAHASEEPVRGFLTVSVAPLSDLERLRKEPLVLTASGREVSIPETLPVGSFVLASHLSPPIRAEKAAEYSFRLVSGGPELGLEEDGRVVVAGSLEGKRVLNATIAVEHRPTQRTATATHLVSVSAVNSHAPVFARRSYEATVSEAAGRGTRVVGLEAVDADGDEVFFALSGPDAGLFSVDDAGSVLLQGPLDREAKARLRLFASAVDGMGHTSSVPLLISVADVNDNAPVLSQNRYSNEVMENSPLGSQLAFVSARDLDAGANGTVEFSLIGFESMALKAALSIDPSAGVVTNVGSLSGLHGEHSFGVVAADGGGLNSAAVVFLNIRPTQSCYPAFTRPSVNESVLRVKEGSPLGTPLGRFAAETLDAGCGVAYALWDPDAANYFPKVGKFAIDPATGALTLAGALDAEERDWYSLIVGAHSQSLYAQTRVVVQVEDLNDNAPAFPVRQRSLGVRESVPQDTVLATFHASDADLAPDNAKVYYHLVKDKDVRHASAMEHFTIHRETGELKLAKSLDSESMESLQFWVMATNEYGPPRQSEIALIWESGEAMDSALLVTVHVLDVNDNGPVFTEETYTVAVPSHLPVGTLITRVRAEDPDRGEGSTGEAVMYSLGEVRYTYRDLESVVEEGLVEVEAETGAVRVAGPLGAYVDGLLTAQLHSFDSADPATAQSHSATLRLWLYRPDHLVSLVVKERPEYITARRAEEIVASAAERIGAEGMLKGVGTETRGGAERGQVAEDRVRLSALFLNATEERLLSAHEALGRLDEEGVWLRSPAAGLGLVSVAGAEGRAEEVPEEGPAGANVGLVVLAVVLILGLLFFGLLLCYFRYSFIQERKVLEAASVREAAAKRRSLPSSAVAAITGSGGLKENPLWLGGAALPPPPDSRPSTMARREREPRPTQPAYEEQELSLPPPPLYSSLEQESRRAALRQASQTSSGYETIQRSAF